MLQLNIFPDTQPEPHDDASAIDISAIRSRGGIPPLLHIRGCWMSTASDEDIALARRLWPKYKPTHKCDSRQEAATK